MIDGKPNIFDQQYSGEDKPKIGQAIKVGKSSWANVLEDRGNGMYRVCADRGYQCLNCDKKIDCPIKFSPPIN